MNSRFLKVRAKPLVWAIVMLLGLLYPFPAATATWTIGDIFAAVGNVPGSATSGQYQVYSNAGGFKETITQPSPNGFTTGCAFNAPQATNLYTTNWSFTKVVVFDRIDPHPVTQTIDAGAPSPLNPGHSQSVVFSRTGPTGNPGDFYVGIRDDNAQPAVVARIYRYNAAGTFQQAYIVAKDQVGAGWIDLAADQRTIFYTSEGQQIKRFDVVAGSQLPDFATLPAFPNRAFALRLLPPGDGTGGLLVADEMDIKRLNSAGIVIQIYTVPPAPLNTRFWFSLSMDPDGVSFWAGDVNSGTFYKFNIMMGTVSTTVSTGVGTNKLYGLCGLGEPTPAVPFVCPANGGDNGDGTVADENGNNGGQFEDDECDNNHQLTHKDPNHNMVFSATGHGRPTFKTSASGLVATSVGQGLANGKPVNYTLVQMGGWPGYYSLQLSDVSSGATLYQRSGWLLSGAIHVK
jgi:hypothetical protein